MSSQSTTDAIFDGETAESAPIAEIWPRPLKLFDMVWGVALILLLSVVFGGIVGVRLVFLGYDQNEILGFLDLPEGKFQLLLGGLASMFLGTLAFLTIFARWRGLRLRDLGLQKTSGRYLAQAMLGLAVVFLVGMVLELFLDASDLTLLRNATAEFVAAEGLSLTVSLVFLIVLVPFTEELFFRAALFGALSRYMPTFSAALLATLLFTASHTQYFLLGGMAAAVGTFQVLLAGGILSWLYVRSRSIWPPVLLHSANNAIAFLFV